MLESDFAARRQEAWRRLDQLCRAGASHLRALSADEILELGRLYRATTSDLAVARRDFPGSQTSAYLNALVARAHTTVYAGERGRDGNRILDFVRFGFPEAFRCAWRYFVLCWGIFLGSALIAWILVSADNRLAEVLVPGAGDLRSVMEQHHLWMKSATENHSVAANFIMLNNIKVAFIAFAGGMLAGLLTAWVLVQNGLMLGGIGALVAHYGLSGDFWSFVVPHGVIELSVIMIAGASGLMIGDALLRPGLLRRSDALTRASKQAVQLIYGCVPLLVIAGTIEAFFSPSNAPDPLKLIVGAVEAVLLYGYLLLSRRPEPGRQNALDTLISGAPIEREPVTSPAAP